MDKKEFEIFTIIYLFLLGFSAGLIICLSEMTFEQHAEIIRLQNENQNLVERLYD